MSLPFTVSIDYAEKKEKTQCISQRVLSWDKNYFNNLKRTEKQQKQELQVRFW